MPPSHRPRSAPDRTGPIQPNPDQLAALQAWLASHGLDENDPRLAEHIAGAPFHDWQLVGSKKAIRRAGAAEPPLRIAIEEALQFRQSRRQPRPPGDVAPTTVATPSTPAATTEPGGRGSRRPTASLAPRPAVDPEPARDAVVVPTCDGLVAVYGDPHPHVRKLLGQELGPIPTAITNRLVANSDAWAGAGAASALRELGGLGQTARDAGRLYQVAKGSQSAVAAAGGLNAGKNGALLPMLRGSNGRITHIVGLQQASTGLRVLGHVTGLALVAFHIVGITNLHKRLVAVEQGVGRLERRFAMEDAARVLLAWNRLAEFWEVYQDQGEPFPTHAMLAMLPDTDELRLLAQRTSLQAATLAEALDPRKLPSDAKRRRAIVEAVRAEEQAISSTCWPPSPRTPARTCGSVRWSTRTDRWPRPT